MNRLDSISSRQATHGAVCPHQCPSSAYRRELNESELENIARAQDWALNHRRDPLSEKFVRELHRRTSLID
jgi:hypothetical protein